jgi:hypothetical protein
MNSIAQYTVGAVKTFRGHDGYAYSCNLLRNNKKVAEVVDDGWGGGLQFHWVDHNTSAVVQTRTYDDKPHSFNGTVEESLFYAEVMKLPKIESSDKELEIFPDADIVVGEMVNEVLMTKEIKSDLKKKLTIQTKDKQLLTWKISAVHTFDVLKAHALKSHPEAVIINELPIENIVKIYKEANIV